MRFIPLKQGITTMTAQTGLTAPTAAELRGTLIIPFPETLSAIHDMK